MVSTIENTLKHAVLLARHLNNCDLYCITVAVLLDLGIPTKQDGFDYLKYAIVQRYNRPVQMVTKELYIEVGKRYVPEAGKQQVEQAIRSAIEEAWENRDEKVWAYYFPKNRHGSVEKPTNAEFISRIARFIELWQGCCKGGAQ